ncbi:unnamed protein product [Polarella glacialis]|uniref:Uncharacterized protein n=1 Tax=Polarella glacialis TaxID=89957 RepID=A0A813EJU6_POLGL|nr:unnamed protein product [Polarella glacialis]
MVEAGAPAAMPLSLPAQPRSLAPAASPPYTMQPSPGAHWTPARGGSFAVPQPGGLSPHRHPGSVSVPIGTAFWGFSPAGSFSANPGGYSPHSPKGVQRQSGLPAPVAMVASPSATPRSSGFFTTTVNTVDQMRGSAAVPIHRTGSFAASMASARSPSETNSFEWPVDSQNASHGLVQPSSPTQAPPPQLLAHGTVPFAKQQQQQQQPTRTTPTTTTATATTTATTTTTSLLEQPSPASPQQPDLMLTPIQSTENKETPDDAVARLRREANSSYFVCIMGTLRGLEAQQMLKVLGQELMSRLPRNVFFVTTALGGITEVFADSCGDATRVWSLVSHGESATVEAKSVQVGDTPQEMLQIFGLLGDMYVSVEGDLETAATAKLAFQRGAGLVPMLRTGGASSGECGFPSEALQRPSFVSEACWALLADTQAPASASATAAAAAVAGGLAFRCRLQKQARDSSQPQPGSSAGNGLQVVAGNAVPQSEHNVATEQRNAPTATTAPDTAADYHKQLLLGAGPGKSLTRPSSLMSHEGSAGNALSSSNAKACTAVPVSWVLGGGVRPSSPQRPLSPQRQLSTQRSPVDAVGSTLSDANRAGGVQWQQQPQAPSRTPSVANFPQFPAYRSVAPHPQSYQVPPPQSHFGTFSPNQLHTHRATSPYQMQPMGYLAGDKLQQPYPAQPHTQPQPQAWQWQPQTQLKQPQYPQQRLPLQQSGPSLLPCDGDQDEMAKGEITLADEPTKKQMIRPSSRKPARPSYFPDD